MRVVIVGAGLAGGNAAVALRDAGHDGEIVVFGNEPGVPFGRPPLSKTYLRGEEDLTDWLVEPDDWYAANDVELRSGEVEWIDAARRSVVAQGTDLAYDRLLVATGCRARVPSIDGVRLEGVLPLRTKSDADAIRERCGQGGANVLVAGMSFIGAEVAASLRQLGNDVTAVFPGTGPLERVLGGEFAARMTAIHRANGVELYANDKVVAFVGSGPLEEAVTESGRRIRCDTAVIGLGVEPNVEWLEGSGVKIDDGVFVDVTCRTNVPDVFAAGDVANHDHPLFGRIRVEHYNNAEKHGRHAGRAMLGSDEPYDYVHSFWSDQYDHKIEYVGYTKEWDELVFRGDVESGPFLGFYLTDGSLRAVTGLDRGGDPEAEPDSELALCARAIAHGVRPDPSNLADDNSDLETVLGV